MTDFDWSHFVRFSVNLGTDDNLKKTPRFPNGWQKYTTSHYNSTPNYAILTGSVNDIIVVDIDKNKKTGDMPGLDWFNSTFGSLEQANTLVTNTWGGGYHIFFKYTPLVKSTALKKLCVDIQSDGKCVFQGKKYNVLYNTPIRSLTDSEIQSINSTKSTRSTISASKASNSSIVPSTLSSSSKLVLATFAKTHFKLVDSDLGTWKIDHTNKCIILSLNSRFCHFIERQHSSNHQYIVFNVNGVKQRCHDSECSGKMYGELVMTRLPKNIQTIIKEYVPTNELEEKAIIEAEKECQNMIIQEHNDHSVITYNPNERNFSGLSDVVHLGFQGHCNPCEIQYIINQDGYYLYCDTCKCRYPRTTTFSFPRSVSTVINQVYVVNNYSNEFDETLDYNIDPSIFEDERIGNLVNESMNGCKSGIIAKLLKEYTQDFVYDSKTEKGTWYYFDGSKWQKDDDNMEMCIYISQLYNEYFEKVKTHYRTNRTEPKIIQCVNNLHNKLEKPQLKNEIISEAKKYYKNQTFHKQLNSNYHLLPFTNGAYDFLSKSFRNSTREDYIEYTVGYDYNSTADNPRVYKFIQEILPDESVRDYVLKSFSNCLNGRSSNEELLLLIGSGSNGKTQLLNLILNTIGDLGEKLSPTLLTRPRRDAGDANPELAKLMHKRFAFVSEPEHGQTFNIAQVKELTGNEKIVARHLYKGSVTFPMICHFYVACNTLPNLPSNMDPNDQSLSRRLRVVNFNSKFVSTPEKENEYLVDKEIPILMETDITWRQTMMNILLEYTTKEVDVPECVLLKTKEYQQDQNLYIDWIRENIEISEGSKLSLKEMCAAYKKDMTKSEKTCFKGYIEKEFKIKSGIFKLGGKAVVGFIGLQFC